MGIEDDSDDYSDDFYSDDFENTKGANGDRDDGEFAFDQTVQRQNAGDLQQVVNQYQ